MLKFERILNPINIDKPSFTRNIRNELITYFLNEQKNLLIKRKKLKLGAITFEVVEHLIPGTHFVMFETIDIRFINQDNTEEDERKFDARLARFKIKNLPLLVLVITFFFLFTLISFCVFSVDLFFNTPSQFASDTPVFKNLFKFSFSKFTNTIGFLSVVNKTLNSTFLEIFSFLLINTLKLI